MLLTGLGTDHPGLTGDREGHRLAAPDTQAVVCGAEVGPGVLCLQIELEGRRFPKSDLRLPENHFFMKKLVLDRVRACLGFTGKRQPVSFDSLGAGRAEGEARRRHGD